MSDLCGGKESVFKDMYWLLRHLLRRNRDICPRCRYSAFRHGHPPFDETYCTKCHLWEPDWKEENRLFEKVLKDNV